MTCKSCGSCAINHHLHGRDGSRPDLCDVCYWRAKAEELRVALSFVTPKCDYLHHPKKYQHKITEPCPVEELIRKAKRQ